MSDLNNSKADMAKEIMKGTVVAQTESADYMGEFTPEIKRLEADGKKPVVETRGDIHYLLVRPEIIVAMGDTTKDVDLFKEAIDDKKDNDDSVVISPK